MENKQLELAIFTTYSAKRTAVFRQDEVIQIIPDFFNWELSV